MRADAALARLRDVSHRPAAHRCSARRNAPSRSPTLPTRRDLRATANGFAQVLVAAAGDGIALTENGMRCARSRRGVDLYNSLHPSIDQQAGQQARLGGFTTDFDRKTAGFSPDRVDALVWALTDLLVEPMPER